MTHLWRTRRTCRVVYFYRSLWWKVANVFAIVISCFVLEEMPLGGCLVGR